MAQAEQSLPTPELSTPLNAPQRRWLRALIILIVILIVAMTAVYFSREKIARNVIEDQLEQLDLLATYEIERISTNRQVLTNVVFGDPAAPDLTVERMEVAVKFRFGMPEIGQIELEKPRLFGTYRDDVLSFGSLDKVLFAPSEEPPSLPELDIKLIDGRAQLLTDFGPVGVKAAGEGLLSDGFEGILAVTAPELGNGDCSARGATLFGDITVSDGEPGFSGPFRLASLRCASNDVTLAKTDLRIIAKVDDDFAGGDARLSGGAAGPSFGQFSARNAGLAGAIAYRGGRVAGDYDIVLAQLLSPELSIKRTSAKGSVRMSEGFNRTEMQSSVEGSGMRAGVDVAQSLSGIIASTEGTLAAPLLIKLRDNLTRELRDGTFAADAIIRKTGQVTSAVVPSARIRGTGGETILAISRLQFNNAGSGPPRLTANIATGGRGLPRINGRMERDASGGPMFRLRMGEYQADDASVAIPGMQIVQSSSGALSFAGQVRASGPLPGGFAEGLIVPVDGRWNQSRGIALWRDCTTIGFKKLQLASLAFERRSLNVCPPPGRAIVDQVGGALRIAAGTSSLNLAGMLGDTPIQIKSGAVGFAYPGVMAANEIDIALGPPAELSSFSISDVSARLGGDIIGQFSGADVSLFAVPLDMRQASGDWRFAGDVLNISGAEFQMEDREETARFVPLPGRDGTLEMADSMIVANASIRSPDGAQELANVDILHDLENTTGSADMRVDGIRFDDTLQPLDLSELAKGVIANADGVVTGMGQVEWNADTVTSRGSFSTDNFDFAAAFGTVTGTAGTVEFVDLIKLTTAPGQSLKVASVYAGVEVVDGNIDFSINDGEVLTLERANFKFAGGTLDVEPVTMRFGEEEVRRYGLNVTGLDAAQFIAGLELGNISATGIFDGSLPLIFDEMGNGRIEGGYLIARAPGGNVSYVGELTYEDITPMVDFAFDALRSLDYEHMRIGMNGMLAGELVTRVEFDGVNQGEGARSNIITRQISKIPLKFRINVRGPFAKIFSSLAAITDSALVLDPRDLGLIDEDGTQMRGETTDNEVEPNTTKEKLPVSEPVQGQESETMP